MFYGTEEKKQAILKHFEGDDRFTIIQSSEGNLEFVQPGISKGRAVAALANELGITADEVMTIGDSNNDLTMLAYAAYLSPWPMVRLRRRQRLNTWHQPMMKTVWRKLYVL